MKQEGMFWHVHHDMLVEYCYNYDKRVEFIKTRKSSNEIEARLRLLQPVKGELPEELVRAGEAFGRAEKDYDEAETALANIDMEDYEAAHDAYMDACTTRSNAWGMWKRVLAENIDTIEKLHSEECTDCLWDDEYQELLFD